jgi:uncharacterized protein (DUF1499 family)
MAVHPVRKALRDPMRCSVTLVLVVSLMALFSCTGNRPSDLGVAEGRLRPCPDTPNCVSTTADDTEHSIPPLDLAVAPAVAWPEVQAAVAAIPRCRVVTATADYLHAEVSSAVFGFVDDLEVYLPAQGNTLTVRSASRLGHSDFGVNRKRVEALREALVERGVVRR